MKNSSKRLQAEITKLYIGMRLKRISKIQWLHETEHAIEQIRALDPDGMVPKLYEIQLLITKECYDEAMELLDEAADWLRVNSQSAPECHAYYLYLTTLMREDAAYDERVTAKLRELSQKNPALWQIAWLLYYVDRELSLQPLEQYHFLKRMFLRGCRSPLMYLEARVLLERNPTFLYEFSEFEVQLIIFMVRHAGMSERVTEILVEYMLQRTDYRYLYVQILMGCYEVSPSKRILESLCRMMVLGGCIGEKFHPWYRRGILERIRVSGLYEAFMKSLPIPDWELDGEELRDERRIPVEVMEYFAHASALDEVRTAYLYALVHKYRENWVTIYKAYDPIIRPFMMESLREGHINAGLAYLYEEVLDVNTLSKEYAEGLIRMKHMCVITGLPLESGILSISYEHCNEVNRIEFQGDRVYAPVYGKHFTISVQHYHGQFVDTEAVVVRQLLSEQIWDAFLENQNIQNVCYHMKKVEEALLDRSLEQNITSVKMVISHADITQGLKEELAAYILPYWDINGEYEEILAAVPYLFVVNNVYQKELETAFWKKQYLQNRIGIYGMQFLLDHYQGSIQEQSSLFAKANSMGIMLGTYAQELMQRMIQEEIILTQHVDIVQAYGESAYYDVDFMQAYLSFIADTYYMQARNMEQILIQYQTECTLAGGQFSVTAKLIYLQSVIHNGVGSLVEEQIQVVKQYVETLLREKVYFSWMYPLQVICPELLFKEAFQVLEYRGEVSGPVWVRFTRYVREQEEAQSFQSDVMECIAPNIYTKNFLLFYGERIQYEIYCLDGTEQKLLTDGILKAGPVLSDTNISRCSKLNHLLSLREHRDNWELYQELESYYGRSAMMEQLFTIK